MTHIDCHTGQQQQPGLAHRYRLSETDGAKVLPGGLLPRKHSPDGAT